MAKTPAVMVPAGDREVRVSSPDRVIYEATDRTPDITKLQVCEYFATVGEAFMRAPHPGLELQRLFFPDQVKKTVQPLD